jgi:large subunit ribosomal protein L6
MSTSGLKVSIEIPKDVTATLSRSSLAVKGAKGVCNKDFSKIPVNLSVGSDAVVLTTPSGKKKDRAMLNTARSLVAGMIRGVTEGYAYRMKVVYAHFPMNVRVKEKEVLIENFMGERTPRSAVIVGDCKVKVEGDDVIIEGASKENVGQTAANIELSTKVKRKDQRIFLDGVYIYEKS